MVSSIDNSVFKVVIGIYDSRPSLEGAVEMLKNAGFRSSDISVLIPTTDDLKSDPKQRLASLPESHSSLSDSGVVVGGVLGWLDGIRTLEISGLGQLIAAGPIVSTLDGVGVSGALKRLTGIDLQENEATRYEGSIRSGGSLLSVHADDREWMKKAREILETSGAKDISSSAEKTSVVNDQAKVLSEKKKTEINPTNLL